MAETNEPNNQTQGEAEEAVIGAVRDDTAQDLQAIKQELEQAQAQAREFFEGWQRERADFANYKRRIERDQLLLNQTITGELVKKYLLVLDDMDRAMKVRPEEGDLRVWSGGIELIYRKLQNILDSENIKRIAAEEQDFDPNRHEAISYEESPDHSSGQIIGVVQEGYTFGDRVLRPARVRVAR